MSRFTIEVVHDDYPEEPYRQGTMWWWHGRYRSPDPIPIPPNAIQLPVYMYDHSAVALSTNPFSCPWDSGQVGVIWIERQPDMTEEQALDLLRAEVAEYSSFLNGEVYRWAIYDEDGNTIDGCGGYYSREHCISDALQEMKEILT